MSNQMPTHFVNQYAQGIRMLAQQMTMKTRQAVRVTNLSGKKVSNDQIGAVRLQPAGGRHSDIPMVNTPHKRRWVTASRKSARDFIDEEDQLQVLNDPTNGYTQAFAAAAAREFDYTVVRGALGTAVIGEDGENTIALPDSQKIPVDFGGAASGLTLPKLKRAVAILKQNHAIQAGDTMHIFITALQEEEFINTTEVKSSDFNTTKVLRDGGVDEFYRVMFHLLDDFEDNDDGRMIPLVGNVRQCPLWVNRGVWANERQPATGRIAWVDEKDAWQVSGRISVGATRTEEKLVVQIDCQDNGLT